MNKRQIKKRNKIASERVNFFNHHLIMCGRKNGKTSFVKAIYKACNSKSYKYFKSLKKMYKNFFISIDWSNSKDYSVKTSYKIEKGITTILKSELLI